MLKKIFFGLFVFAALALAIGFIVGTKILSFAAMAEAGKLMLPPPESVATFTAEHQTWGEELNAIGSIEPVLGVRLDAEVAGVVSKINFDNGQNIEAGEVLVELDVTVEAALLRSQEATVRLAKVEHDRTIKLLKTNTISQSQFDRTLADLEKAQAQIENLKAVIERKTIRAPFSGRLGIREINLGQYASQGSPIVTLQSYDQVFVNFSLPQKALARVKTGMRVTLRSDVYPEHTFEGAITAISPQIDPITRSITIQGTLENPDELLRAGLFVKATVTLPQKNEVLVVPATSIVYAPYGNSIYKVETVTDEETGVTNTVAKQSFIRTGKRIGDFVSVLEGLKAGDEVVSAGAFKLSNGTAVTVNNDMAPTPELAPTPNNS